MKETLSSIDFDNTALAFEARSDAQLRRDHQLFRLIDAPLLTRLGSPLLAAALRLHLPVQGLIRHTLFSLFCGGESLEETGRTSAYLDRFHVKTILDYAVEGERSIAGFDKTRDEIRVAIRHAGQHDAVAFTSCKLTGLGSIDMMTRMQTGEPLGTEDQQAYQRLRKRMYDLADAARDARTPIFIDAEESWIQDTIDGLAEELMATYNREVPLIFTTLQLYRHDRLDYLRRLIADSSARGYVLGVKLVRGAYLEKENRRAAKMGYPTPMQPNKAATDRDYDAALAHCIEHIDHVAVCAGSHNEQSALHLTRLMQERGLPPDHPHVWFAQLLGMSDHISFNLSHAGYNVAKYLPYGPIRAVMPYLIRRAEENTSVAGQSGRELSLLRKELKRRRQA
ncbi:MAG: proline dehydrogenase family protein [Bacteroidia bacterium]